jgi:hypothetical protein
VNIREVVEKLSLELKTPEGDLGRAVTGCYISDLLSDVMANAREGDIWITLQTHPNIVAVASLKNLAGIVITNRRSPEEETLKKAEDEHITIAVSPLSTFEVGGMLYTMLRC